MAQISQLKWIEPVKRGAVSVLYVVGSAFAAYNITAFKTDKFGLYFKDDNQLWLAVGVALIAIGWAIRHWKKL
jgi:hypothetical protein